MGGYVPSSPPIHTSGTAMSTVLNSLPVKLDTSSMYALNNRNAASAADPMAYPLVVACRCNTRALSVRSPSVSSLRR
jgi:hypothetical protein